MTAAVLYGKEDLKIEKVPIPIVGDGEVLVKVQVALTCGTDLKVYQRGYHARMIVPPALFGHELAGVDLHRDGAEGVDHVGADEPRPPRDEDADAADTRHRRRVGHGWR